jgi:GGDEF domain-containing protein
MAFDPATAKPLGAGFDPSTAQPAEGPTAKLGDSFAPIGDLPPNFGEAKMQPDEVLSPEHAAYGLGRALLRGGRGLSISAAGIPLPLGDRFREAAFGAADKYKALENSLPQPTTTGERVAQGLGALPGGVLTLGSGEAGAAGQDAIDRGASLANAEAHTALGGIGSEIGLGVGMLGKGLPARLLLQPAAAVASGEGQREVSNALSPADQQQPFDPIQAGINAGAGLGGAFFPNGRETTAPHAADLHAQESVTAANPLPTGADALKAISDQVAQDIKAQSSPVPNPVTPVAPPVRAERAAALSEKSNGPAPARPDVEAGGSAGTRIPANPDPAVAAPPEVPAAPVAQEPPAPVAAQPRPTADAPESVPVAGGVPDAASGPRVEPSVEPNVPQQPFTPEERHAARLDQHLQRLGDITPEQRQAVIEHHGDVQRDPVMNLPERRDLVPTIEAAKQQGGGSYGEFDIKGVGNINSHLGSNSAADPHLRAVADIVNRNLQEAAKESGGQVVLTRKGGDELGAIAKGVDAETLHAAGLKAQAEVDAYAKQHGLDQAPATKNSGGPGFGLHFGVSDITPERHVSDIIADADRTVELRKKGKVGYEYSRQTATPWLESSGKQAGGIDGGSDAGLRQGPSGRDAAQGRETAAKPAAEASGEVALAEPPAKPEPVKPPPAKPAEVSAAPTEPRDTSVRNAATAVDRATMGLDDLPEAERKGWEKSKAEAADAMAKDPDYARNLAREVLQSKRPLPTRKRWRSVLSASACTSVQIQRRRNLARARIWRHEAEVKARIRKQSIEEDLDTNHRATQAGGTELARAMAARNAQIKEDYSAPRTMTRARVAYGDKFTPKVEAQLKELTAQLAEKDKRIAEFEAKAPSLKARSQRTRAGAAAKVD